MKPMLALAAVLLLAGCSAGSPTTDAQPKPAETSTADQPADERAAVEWEDYDATVQTRIDELETAADCTGLQQEFDTADANSTAMTSRAGHSNAKLMSYIDEAMRAAGCY